MKLIVIIPAYNEEKTIGLVIKEIPRQIKGIDQVEVLVIDDGSIDQTVGAAKQAGADYVFLNKANKGLAFSFGRGLEEALKLDADIIVNTDADFQYDQTEIPKLIQPILEDKADVVFGNRQIKKLSHMPWSRKYGNILGSAFLRMITGSDIIDASSGFRAFSREAALRIVVYSNHTYTHETIIQLIDKNMRLSQLPIIFKERQKDESRLIKGFFQHIERSLLTIIKVILIHKPLRILVSAGGLLAGIGFILGLRYLFFFFIGQSSGHVQSLILASILISIGAVIAVMGILADLINVNRKIMEEVLWRLKKRDYQDKNGK